jgi:peptide/nickel transport system substrate-binding protein
MKRAFEIHVQSENEQSVQGAQLFQSDLAQIGINLKVSAASGRTCVVGDQARDHARHVGALGLDLLRRSRELGRPDVRQPVPRHLEGLGLLQERRGRRAAAQGAGLVKQEERAPLYEAAIRQIMAD